jgi:hypothetical protein
VLFFFTEQWNQSEQDGVENFLVLFLSLNQFQRKIKFNFSFHSLIMSISEDFYLKFPSLNVNSKENIRNRRITQDCVNFLTQTNKSPRKDTKNYYKQRRSQISDNVITHQSPQSPLEVIFSVEERNQYDNQMKLEQQRIYQRVLEKQIKEQQLKKQREKLKRQEEERIFEE